VAIATGRVVKVIALDSATDAEVQRLVHEVPNADLVMMITPAGTDARAAAVIGDACSRAQVMTMALVVRDAETTDEALSNTLAQVRPWSLMVVVASDEGYADDILRSFR
jgi:hypothetical protein